ncbi:4-(cytidine 5'-diphospho)-2-C-methyl-D-erythritol kinase [Rhizobium sp. TRM95796]|uniref:4-(cytidine 5'-diphospho)-2-C-methyl-D-erythritol kinase n=1 Tax=Rhizobium sp. TRM95796 TaxID=2979862 RepID=UPI0021E9548A|nr:4-(cytidine 5'-diphospho)-2-C-methyl-D-erythritol kinase [Rhizobium sp. TRM95796]MCV3766334.1 4-(cytidine 5'-diphospho)-2-C-methyl-D-erythritol kinase [Rhizobium sp. TRM95796]
MIEEFAPAKINLALHVTGQRADGYHLLDSLVVFASAGDRLTIASAERDRFSLSGRFGPALSADDPGNLALRARDALRSKAAAIGRDAGPVHIHLEKNLPIASGIGGGSADAAAVLRGLNSLWSLGFGMEELRDLGLPLGADVPMCVESRPLVARGVGEDITLLARFPALDMLLVNPLVEVSTPAIFKRLTNKTNPTLSLPGEEAGFSDWITALQAARNDLQPPAEHLAPEIAEAMALLTSTAPLLARMSGSGATCFALYPDRERLSAAARALEAERPDWYWQACASTGEF